jgi:aminoglycoside phosphotransferase (APT) family kinase protein
VTPTTDLPGIDAERTGTWLAGHLDGDPPFSFELMAAGGSNLTFRVTDSLGCRWALRRPPEGRRLATAHDVDREWRVLEAVHGSDVDVPVPRPVARCDDLDVTGAPFFVMDFVDGTILRTQEDGVALGPTAGRRAAESLVDVHARLHQVDVDAVGLGDLGPRAEYVERQLRRWMGQVEEAAGPRRPEIGRLHRRLQAAIPPQPTEPAVLHGDYRFDNVVVGGDHDVVGVLDWELCALGDPVADACWSLLYWADGDDDHTFLPSSPTLAEAIPDRDWAISRYEERSGRSLSAWPWFSAFGWWKMACIVDGVHARYRAGSRGGATPGDLQAIAERGDRLVDTAREAAAAAGI